MSIYLDKLPKTLNTVERVRWHFQEQKWPLPTESLDQRQFIMEQARQWAERGSNSGVPETKPPTTANLFDLAVDANYGQYPELRGLRFRVSRLMARWKKEDLGPFVQKYEGGNLRQPKSMGTAIKRFESGKAVAEGKMLEALAHAYGVESEWLSGVAPKVGTLEQLALLVKRSSGYGPKWLRPWQAAVAAAVEVCHELQRQESSTDTLLSDNAYAGEMLRRFFERRAKDMTDPAGQLKWLLYFPLAHAAMVKARERVLLEIPTWMYAGQHIVREPTESSSKHKR